MKINILNKGDKVINVTEQFVAVQRKNGEVDIIMIKISDGSVRVDMSNVVTIGYGAGIVETKVDEVMITEF